MTICDVVRPQTCAWTRAESYLGSLGVDLANHLLQGSLRKVHDCGSGRHPSRQITSSNVLSIRQPAAARIFMSGSASTAAAGLAYTSAAGGGGGLEIAGKTRAMDIDRSALVSKSDAISEVDDDASFVSKHSLKTLANGGGPAPSLPSPFAADTENNSRLILGNAAALPDSSDGDDDEPEIRNTITGSRFARPDLPRPYSDSDDEAHWTDLSGTPVPQHQTVRITINGNEDDAANAETKAMIIQERRRVLVRVGSQILLLFMICFVALFCTLWLGLPEIDEADRPAFKIPRSFEEFKALNGVLQHYKTHHGFRVFVCWEVIYLFLQAFSIPGSMYLSILAGAIWGVALSLPIVICSIASGATICYVISRQMGEVFVAVPSWKTRVDSWQRRISAQSNLFSYLVFIRHLPLPPHWVVNVIAPHLGISIPLFWLSTAVGVMAISFIHVTIGAKLDEMTSPDDFHLASWQNFFLLAGVCVAVMTPIAVRRFSGAAPLEEPQGHGEIALPGEEGERTVLNAGGATGRPARRPWSSHSRGTACSGTASPLYDDANEEEQRSDDELPSITIGKLTPRVRISGAEDTSSPWHPPQAMRHALTAIERECDADDVMQNPFDSDADDDEYDGGFSARGRFPDRAEQRRAGSASIFQASKAARTLGIGNVTNKAAKVLGLSNNHH
ncbi:hypothetical protein K437DRAFT_253900 [Tilletiaria anomala UBC 951]|uniref:VTT domain-containing protein n=1 Tax=Tilletiaria anomala (strain ATCC 24038 / CBS 436.72 / UBC 951) TaxID=1037660 RepID=A0A066WFF4_TILAU|nr:uncharacterized protein K437DRAFT_253900 [Tilletiaria anomala UBC 951]KDN52707.1 hypothetical protein K437DRAFT_253900 [Tilletiaria anomala UBC 951]